MVNLESREIPGVSQAVVDRYGADTLRRLLNARSDPRFYFEYDRGTVPDGANVTAPFPCNRHVADNWKRGWLAIRMVEEHCDGRTGGKWREVESLPAELRIAGEVA